MDMIAKIQVRNIVNIETRASAKILPGGGNVDVLLNTFKLLYRCNANGRSQNGLSCLHHKESAPCYGDRRKNALRWQK